MYKFRLDIGNLGWTLEIEAGHWKQSNHHRSAVLEQSFYNFFAPIPLKIEFEHGMRGLYDMVVCDRKLDTVTQGVHDPVIHPH